MPRASSIDIEAQTLPVPVVAMLALGMALKVHFKAPVRASTAKTVPGGFAVSVQSLPAQPTNSVSS